MQLTSLPHPAAGFLGSGTKHRKSLPRQISARNSISNRQTLTFIWTPSFHLCKLLIFWTESCNNTLWEILCRIYTSTNQWPSPSPRFSLLEKPKQENHTYNTMILQGELYNGVENWVFIAILGRYFSFDDLRLSWQLNANPAFGWQSWVDVHCVTIILEELAASIFRRESKFVREKKQSAIWEWAYWDMEHANGNRCPEGRRKVSIPEIKIIQNKLKYNIKGKNKRNWKTTVRRDGKSGNEEGEKQTKWVKELNIWRK